MKNFLKEARPFMMVDDLTKDFEDKDWQNPFMIYLFPLIIIFLMLDLMMLPLTSFVFFIKYLIRYTK